MIRAITRGSLRLFLCLVAVAAAFWLGFRTVQQPAIARTYSPKPFTYQHLTVAHDLAGRATLTEQRTVAVRSDGSEVWVGTFPNKPEAGVLRKVMWSDGRAATIVEKLGIKMSQYLPLHLQRSREKAATAAGPDCRFGNETSGGAIEILGVKTAVSHRQSSATKRDTVWRALEYGCAVMAIRYEVLDQGTWKLQVEAVPVFFRDGEPARELFDETYYDRLDEVSPSEANRRVLADSGITAEQCPVCYDPHKLETLDRQYYANQR